MLSELFIKVILALIFGATIGLERESSRHGETSAGGVGGIRTFSLIALIGALAGIFFVHNAMGLALLAVSGFLILLISNYIIEAISTHAFGITSELSAVGTFFLGLLVVIDIIPLQVTNAIIA